MTTTQAPAEHFYRWIWYQVFPVEDLEQNQATNARNARSGRHSPTDDCGRCPRALSPGGRNPLKTLTIRIVLAFYMILRCFRRFYAGLTRVFMRF